MLAWLLSNILLVLELTTFVMFGIFIITKIRG